MLRPIPQKLLLLPLTTKFPPELVSAIAPLLKNTPVAFTAVPLIVRVPEELVTLLAL